MLFVKTQQFSMKIKIHGLNSCRGCRKLLHFDALASLSSLRDLAMPAASQDKDIAEVRQWSCPVGFDGGRDSRSGAAGVLCWAHRCSL